MNPTGRQWSVLLDVDCDGAVHAKVSVGGKTLLPAMDGGTPERALRYVEAALVDMKPGDVVHGAVECPIAAPRRYRVGSLAMFKLWLAEVLGGVFRIVRLASRCRRPHQ